MFKEKLKKLPSRILYILFALVISFALWLYVELTVNEEQEITVPNIPISLRNEDVLRDRGWIPSILTENLTMTFRGPRTDLQRLAPQGALSVAVDVANIQRTGAIQLVYDIVWPSLVNQNAVDVLDRSAMLITLHIDMELEVQIPVNVNYTGGTASPELTAEAAEVEPRFITVRGSEEVVSRISHAYVPILRESLSSTYTEDLEFILIDDDGEQIEDNIFESLVFSHNTIRVTIPIREIKNLHLEVSLHHGATTADYSTTVTVYPQYVTVSADPDVIREIHTIMLGTVDTTTFSTSTTVALPILLGGGMENISGQTEATVYIEVLGLDIVYLNTSIIYVTGTPPGLTETILTELVLVTLRGRSEDLALVYPENIRVVADISELGEGTTSVVARIFIDGIEAPIDPIGESRITVTLEPEE